MLLVAAEGNRPVRRRYTIRQFDAAARLLTLDIVLHGDGPGERWVRAAPPGDRIEGIGPRGKITASATADWHLFLGDESALAAVFAMTEALPGDRVATLVSIFLRRPTTGPDRAATIRLSWLHRFGARAGDRSPWRPRRPKSSCPPGAATPTCSARRRSCPRCGRSWPGAGSARTRCHRRRTGAAAA